MTIELGGNITLTGFKQREFAELIVVKKIVGQYARRFSDDVKGFEHLTVTLKEVHAATGGSGLVEVHGNAIVNGKTFVSEMTAHNLFIALDGVLKKIMAQLLD